MLATGFDVAAREGGFSVRHLTGQGEQFAFDVGVEGLSVTSSHNRGHYESGLVASMREHVLRNAQVHTAGEYTSHMEDLQEAAGIVVGGFEGWVGGAAAILSSMVLEHLRKWHCYPAPQKKQLAVPPVLSVVGHALI